jgi:hypothetical protein
MTDSELDEILNKWTAPPVPPSLRERVRAAFPVRPQRTFRWRKSLVAAAVLAAAVFFLIATQASPQPTAPIPWTVDSEFVRYADDGSSSIEMYSTSYESNSNEILLSRSMPGNIFKTALARAADAIIPIHNRIMRRFMVDPKLLEQVQRASAHSVGFITGCDSYTCLVLNHSGYARAPAGAGNGCIEGEVVDRATILNYPTEAVRERWTEHGRMTIWTAPALGCFALKVTQEEERPDGTFHLVAAKHALKVTVNGR